WQLAHDVMARFIGRDVDFFMPTKLHLDRLAMQTPPREEDLMAIMRDYGRMLLMLRQRIILEDPVAYETERDYSKYGTNEFFELMRQKHKYRWSAACITQCWKPTRHSLTRWAMQN
ncbi:hypothetical protein ACVBEH_16510, partial [Roseateles sp. GG27B]